MSTLVSVLFFSWQVFRGGGIIVLEKERKKEMKKISYVFTLIALLLLPTICFAQTIDNSNSISDIKVENSSTDEVKDKVIISFKVLKDLDISISVLEISRSFNIF